MNILHPAGFAAGLCFASALCALPVCAEAAPRDPCGGLTAADAAAIIHVPLVDVQGPITTRDVSCSYRDTANIFKGVGFNLSVESSAAVASRKLHQQRDNLAIGNDSVVAVKNLGDEAWRVSGPDVIPRLLMRKGSTWLDVAKPEDEPSELRIARIVLQHMSGGG